jgi:hypothetical protein
MHFSNLINKNEAIVSVNLKLTLEYYKLLVIELNIVDEDGLLTKWRACIAVEPAATEWHHQYPNFRVDSFPIQIVWGPVRSKTLVGTERCTAGGAFEKSWLIDLCISERIFQLPSASRYSRELRLNVNDFFITLHSSKYRPLTSIWTMPYMKNTITLY